MVLTKEEAIGTLEDEVRVILHLASKIEPKMLDYRPSSKQRSLLELMQYLVVMAPAQLKTIVAGDFTMDSFRAHWQTAEAAAKAMSLEDAKAAIAKQSALFAELIGPLSDVDLRAEIEMFGRKASRGFWIIRLPLSHYSAYRMQLFLYLKACGRTELSTMNLWMGADAS
jgi:hypothetical protein